MPTPDWENFAKAVLADWPTGDLDGSVLFDLSVQYGMIQEVPGGYNSDHHIDADGICPEEGDPWYEYTFRGEAGPGMYSISDVTNRIEELEAKLAKAVEALEEIMVGGNHLAVWLPDNHPPADVEPLVALEKIGAGVSYDVWCCWRSIMLARTTLAELKG